MKDLDNASKTGKLFMTCVIDEVKTWENISPEHILAYVFSGELTLNFGSSSMTFVAGDTMLVPKNLLSRSVKTPTDGKPFKCLSVVLPEEQLRNFYQNHPILETWSEDVSRQRPVKPNPLLESFFTSLLPYFDVRDELPEELVPIKIQELLTIIDSVDKRMSSILGKFHEIGKIDLEQYMEAHYMFNLPIERFAYLTGRSLTTFKSDFKKTFKNTPGRWLTEKRLNLAHYKLSHENKKASDIYLSVGFENLSHFSFAFKKAFGYSPSNLATN